MSIEGNLTHKTVLKKIIIIMCIFTMLISSSSCGRLEKRNPDKLFIVTTLFPQYDFAKNIVGDKGEVKLLLSPGLEAHSYDPTPADIVDINESDLFIYTGDEMEAWVADITKGLENKVDILDISEGIDLVKEEDVEEENVHYQDIHYDNIENEHGENEHEESEDEHNHKGHKHEHIYDPHIWTSPVNAMIMVQNILDELVKIDSDNEDYYRENAGKYLKELEDLDNDIRKVVDNCQIKTIFFADKFAMYYFVNEYGLHYISAYDSCSAETEPSAKLVAAIIDEVRECNATTIYYAELSNHKSADTISEETGSKALLLHSCHNVSKKEFRSGVTYLSLMRQNLENLKVGLKYVE